MGLGIGIGIGMRMRMEMEVEKGMEMPVLHITRATTTASNLPTSLD